MIPCKCLKCGEEFDASDEYVAEGMGHYSTSRNIWVSFGQWCPGRVVRRSEATTGTSERKPA